MEWNEELLYSSRRASLCRLCLIPVNPYPFRRYLLPLARFVAVGRLFRGLATAAAAAAAAAAAVTNSIISTHVGFGGSMNKRHNPNRTQKVRVRCGV